MKDSNLQEKNKFKSQFSKKRIVFAILLSIGFTAFLYIRELNENSAGFSSLSWTVKTFLFLFLGLIMMAIRDTAYMIRLRLLTDRKLSWKKTFNVIMLWEFASALSPGVVGGSVAAAFIIQQEKIPLGKSTAIVMVASLLDNLFYLLLIPIVLFWISFSDLFPADLVWLNSVGMQLFWLGYGILLVVNAIFFTSVFFSPRIMTTLIKYIFMLPIIRRFQKKADKISNDFVVASKEMRGKRFKFWLKTFAATSMSWIARFLVLNFTIAAFIQLNFIDHLLVLGRQLVVWLIMIISPTPGGSGMAEFLFSEIYLDYIVASGLSAISLALIWRTLSYYPYLIIGSFILPKWLSKRKL
ncbi:lysylphosphatidylglycerol synthase transmembrane domain-containing protein [Crocinitomix catalasitica]|uniref:lysylphosphatidylglycerol synthase transmembrane domain-containing protein n=1 Tax=Crocinitomix catalasitica TaxID=184607 RepID=UPI00068649E5|nr:lysylphosphatidylglycerol synthase transmembrane domain-containing protein [Crocinitomix catalasitica]